MKKITIITVMALSIFGLSSLSFAETFYKFMGVPHAIVEGQIVSVDSAKNQFVVKDHASGLEKRITTDSTAIASLNKGGQVRVVLEQGSPVAHQIVK